MGREICIRLAQEGCKLIGFDINDKMAAETAELVQSAGGEIQHWHVDISNYASVSAAVAEAEEAVGQIDVLVNNAGWDRVTRFVDTDEALHDKVMAINLKGPVNMMHVVVRRMAGRGYGRVISVASDAGRVGSSGQAVYSACKGGVIAMSKTLAREHARGNILFNVVCPGPTDTPLMDTMVDGRADIQKIFDGLNRSIPLRRLGRADDIPGAIAFFASDDAAFITGQVISVSGGLTMHG
jgi:2-hydroxycyclohexanecarboxyl-CoA dehydrogenase